MRTTLNIDDDLLREAKELAARSRRSLRAVIEDALRECFSRFGRQADNPHVELPVSPQPPGVQPGVDLDDTASLVDLMEQDRGSA